MIAIRKESAEVLYPEEDVVIVTAADLDELKQLALQNPRRRVRLCAHRSPQDHLHEMFIVHTSNCYVRPHKHLGKAESMTVLEGEVDVVFLTRTIRYTRLFRWGHRIQGKFSTSDCLIPFTTP